MGGYWAASKEKMMGKGRARKLAQGMDALVAV